MKIQLIGKWIPITIALLTTGAFTHAQNGVWNVDADGNWSDTANWLGGTIADGPDATADFSSLNNTDDRTVTSDSARVIGHLKFGDLAGAQGWLMVTNGSGDVPLTLAVSSGSPTITVNNNAATNRLVLAGTQGFVKLGAGSLTLQGGANVYSGSTVVSNGTLVLNKPAGIAAVPGDLVIHVGATVAFASAGEQIANAATVTVNAGATLNMNTRSETIDTLILSGGTINQSGSEMLVANTVDARDGEILQTGGTGKLDVGTLSKSTTGTVLLASKGSANDRGITNLIINNGVLLLDYSQTQGKLNDAGTLTLNGGILMLTNFSSAESVGALILNAGVITNASGTASLNLPPGGNFDVRSGQVYTALGNGAGRTLTKSTAGTVVLAADNTYSGGTLISGGTLQIGNGGTNGQPGSTSAPITNNASLVFNRSGANLLSISGAISGSGSVTKLGSGSVALTSANNSYSGNTTISNGAINISSTSTLGDGAGTLYLSGGTLNTTASRSTSAAPLSNPIVLTADSAITTTSGSTAVDLNLSNDFISGSAGSLTFRNDGANAGGDVFDPRFSGSLTFNRPIVIDNGSVGQTRLSSFNTIGTTQTFNGVISGSGSFRRSVSTGTGGTTVFNAHNTYSGTTVINDGTLLVNGSLGTNTVTVSDTLGGTGTIKGPVVILSSGTLSPGASIGILTISNTLSLGSGSTTVMELNAANHTSDQVAGLTSVSYGGTLQLNVSGTLVNGQTFQLFKASSYSGAFSSLSPATPGVGKTWNTNLLTVNGTISVIDNSAVPQPAFTSVVRLVDRNIQFWFSGGTGQAYRIWACTNLTLTPITNTWTLLTNGTFGGAPSAFTDGQATNFPQRFYFITSP